MRFMLLGCGAEAKGVTAPFSFAPNALSALRMAKAAVDNGWTGVWIVDTAAKWPSSYVNNAGVQTMPARV